MELQVLDVKMNTNAEGFLPMFTTTDMNHYGGLPGKFRKILE